MTRDEIFSRLKTLGLPVAYREFKNPAELPFIAYYIESEEFSGSDYENLIIDRILVIEFYSITKDDKTEQNIEELFTEFEISKDEEWIDSEAMLQITYTIHYKFKKRR